MSTFGITDTSQLLDAVNYALSNLGQSANAAAQTGNTVTINTTTGVIGEGGYVLSYLYRYLTIRYGTSSAGAGLTTNPVGATYFGVYNNNSTSPPDPSNPGNYQWTQTSSALSSTNLLWYSTLGGRQVQFYVGTQASLPQPASNWAQVNNATPSNVIDLDFVTATATLPLVVMTAYYNAANANVAPATPTGGTYDFGNLIFTAPSGWANSIPANNVAFFSSQNQFQSTASGNLTVGPVDPWTTPVLTGKLGTDGANGANGTNGANGVSTFNYPIYQSANSTPATPTGGYWNFATSVGTPPTGWANVATAGAGNVIYVSSSTVSSNIANANVAVSTWSTPIAYSGTGAQGPRGSMPMAYIISNANPIGANVTSLNTWFAASPTGTPAGSNSAPIGTGFFPQTGDTAAFTSSANASQVAVLTYSSNTSPVWTSVVGNIINGNLFVTQSINAGKLNANDVYTLNLTGGTGVVGNNSSGGFWMQASSGNARMAGSVSIGNLLTVGSNAVIGGNLSIGANANIGSSLIVGNNASIGGNLTVSGLITGGGLNTNTVSTTTIVANAVTTTNQLQYPNYTTSIDGLAASSAILYGTVIANAASSAGNVITTSQPYGGYDTNTTLVGSKITMVSGTGAFAANTVVTAGLSPTTFSVNPAPTTPLSGATVRILPTISQSNTPYLPLTTTGVNDLITLNFNGSTFWGGTCTALAGGVYAQFLVYVQIILFDGSGTYYTPPVFSATLTSTQVFIDGVQYSFVIPFSLTGIFSKPGTADTWYYIPWVYWEPYAGSFTMDALGINSYAASGTVFKR